MPLFEQFLRFIENLLEPLFQFLERGGRPRPVQERRTRRQTPPIHDDAAHEQVERVNRYLLAHPADVENLVGFLRLILAFSLLIMFSILGGYIFEWVDAVTPARHLKETNFFFQPVPFNWLKYILYIFNWHNARYMVMPLAAMTAVLIAGAYFVTDIYNLPSVRYGLRYVLASMFGIDYPKATVDDGLLQNTKPTKQSKQSRPADQPSESVQGQRETASRRESLNPAAESRSITHLNAHQQRRALVDPNHVDEAFLLDEVGGPGFLLIQPGNAVLFRTLRRPMRAGITEGYFLAPFERIGQIANLDDQHGYAAEIPTVTRDGIPVLIREIHFRFRILPESQGGRPMMRSLENPYPFSQEAMQSMAYNLSVEENGLSPWRGSVQRAVIGAITDYFNSHQIDELTAPRQNGVHPRMSILDELAAQNRRALRNLGAELIWIDIGHFDIVPEEVDRARAGLWAAEWQGNVRAVLAESEAKKQAYEEVGRAEAQAELIRSITKALENANLAGSDKELLRKLLLVRTAQILDTMNR